SPCTGDDRGLCCGCSQNEDCGDVDKVGCGNDTCCRARPEIDSFAPADDSVNVCRNAEIRATFNELMNISSFSGNIFVAGDYGFQDCPANTVFLAKDNNIKDNIFIKAFKYLARRFNFINNLALAYTSPTVHNYCAVRGTVRGINNPDNTTTISFAPYDLLDPSRLYYAIIKGQEDLAGATTGVMNTWGIGFNGDGEATAPVVFNATNIINGKIWSFTTLSEEQDSGICQIDRVEIFPSSYLFKTTKNNLNDEKDDKPNDKSFDTVADSDKVFIAYALSADDQILAPTKGYWWNWDWSIEKEQVASIADAGLNADGDRQLIRAKEGITDSKTSVYAQVNIEGRDDTKRGEAKIWVFLCENPWPPVNDEGLWQPWTDLAQGCLANTGECHDTNYEIYYCRDAGKAGTFDDLPAIEDNAVIRGQSTDNTLVCTDPYGNCIGKSKDSACGLNGKCVLAPNILKETYYFREVIPTKSTSFKVEDQQTGGEVLVSWAKVSGATSYKIYYRLKNVSSYSTLEVTSLEVCQTDPCSKTIAGLDNNKEYVFNLSSLNESQAESELSGEVFVTPTKQINKLDKPTGLKANLINSNQIKVEWLPNKDGITKGYILYYGTSHAIYGKEIKVGDVINYTFDIVGGNAYYFITLRAYDEFNNLSEEADEIIVIPAIAGFYFENALTNVDFEDGEVGSVPTNWKKSAQAASSIGISTDYAFSGSKSVKIHQDANKLFPGICNFDICSEYSVCFWDSANNQCSFNRPDYAHATNPAVYKLNEKLVSPNDNRIMYAKLVFDISQLKFEIGKEYILAFYYKGVNATQINALLSFNNGWATNCQATTAPGASAIYDKDCTYDDLRNNIECTGCLNGNNCLPQCEESPGYICYAAPYQYKCYKALSFGAIPYGTHNNGKYNGWNLYMTETFEYTEELNSHYNSDGELYNEIGLTIGYITTEPHCSNTSATSALTYQRDPSKTSPENQTCSTDEECSAKWSGSKCLTDIPLGTDFYIDNFIVAEAVAN
ncbi:MAG: Ig-like domain-containing protein, partial [Patescibacteria group bacterium]